MNLIRLPFALAAVLLLPTACGDREAPPPIRTTPVYAVDTPPPEYPLEVACAGVGGRAVLSVRIGKDGRPADITLKQSSGNAELDEAAQAAVRGWQFRAATTNGQPIETVIDVPMTFNAPQPRPQRCFALDEKLF
jgi:protein TonB